MIDARRIEEMKHLSVKATEGPWDYMDDIFVCQGDGMILGDCVAKCETEIDANFIAKSRRFVPDIIEAYEEAKVSADAYGIMVRDLNEMVKERDIEITKLRKALEDIQSDCEYAKERYIEESDIDDILETVKEALKRKERFI